MKVAVIKELFPGEHRVALVPAVVSTLVKADHAVLIESNAGLAAGFSDADYEQAGGRIVDRDEAFRKPTAYSLFARAEPPVKHGNQTEKECPPIQQSSAWLTHSATVKRVLKTQKLEQLSTRWNLFLVLRVPKAWMFYQAKQILQVTRLSFSELLALKKILPMMTTAAGTIRPAKALILGAGVAGLQAIATAKRLGAQVLAYDVRPAVKEQVESLGAKFVELDLETESSETKGGYAKAMTRRVLQKAARTAWQSHSRM